MENLARYSDIEYFMPFLFTNDIFMPVLHKLLENETNPIKYVYGSPYCEWGKGARSSTFKLSNLNLIQNYLKSIKEKYNYVPVFTFTNLNSKESLNDEFSNNLLDIGYSLDCRFIVASDELFNHIKSRYPDAKLHCSVTIPTVKITEEKDFDETDFYRKMLDKYEIVVVRPEYILNNIDNIEKLIPDLSGIEVLINQICHFNCPNYRQHHDFIIQLDEKKLDYLQNQNFNSDFQKFHLCQRGTKDYKSTIINDEKVQKLIASGVKNFKIQGRPYPFDMMFEELYNFFFNKNISKEEIKNRVDKICAEMLENNKKAALYLCMN